MNIITEIKKLVNKKSNSRLTEINNIVGTHIYRVYTEDKNIFIVDLKNKIIKQLIK